jgi:Protein of unknown function (DUF2752)
MLTTSLVLSSPKQRLTQLAVFGLLVAWFVYTYLYFDLHARGLTFAPSLFMHLTRHPDPTCGLTRTFAWMWRGDVAQALLVYPLGPVVFLASLAAAGYLLASAATGRGLGVRLPPGMGRRLVVIVLALIGLNWMVKLLWLGI